MLLPMSRYLFFKSAQKHVINYYTNAIMFRHCVSLLRRWCSAGEYTVLLWFKGSTFHDNPIYYSRAVSLISEPCPTLN